LKSAAGKFDVGVFKVRSKPKTLLSATAEPLDEEDSDEEEENKPPEGMS
jgi:hypothetical protein